MTNQPTIPLVDRAIASPASDHLHAVPLLPDIPLGTSLLDVADARDAAFYTGLSFVVRNTYLRPVGPVELFLVTDGHLYMTGPHGEVVDTRVKGPLALSDIGVYNDADLTDLLDDEGWRVWSQPWFTVYAYHKGTDWTECEPFHTLPTVSEWAAMCVEHADRVQDEVAHVLAFRKGVGA